MSEKMALSLQRKDSDAELTPPGQKSDMIYIWGENSIMVNIGTACVWVEDFQL